jgi:hypothetical protein
MVETPQNFLPFFEKPAYAKFLDMIKKSAVVG